MEGVLEEMLEEHSIDLLILAEYPFCIANLCNRINTVSSVQYKELQNISCNRISGIVNGNYSVTLLSDESRFKLIKMTNIAYEYELIIAMIHGTSSLWQDDDTKRIGITKFISAILAEEHKSNCEHSLAIGDFNVNPFEEACIGAFSMHGIPFPDATMNESRKVEKTTCRKFYNPTWRFFGNRDAPYTTYYCDRRGQNTNFYWYAVDQVFIRPSLIRAFDMENFKIITKTKSHTLLGRNNIPDKAKYSDHLPLLCSLKEDLI